MTAYAISPIIPCFNECESALSLIIPKSSESKTYRGIGGSQSSITSPPTLKAENSEMRTPGMSRGMNPAAVMCKHFGVSIEQMKRTQALLRLGVTEEDVIVAEKLFAELPGSEELITKEERLLGLTRSEISFFKALEVLGADLNVVEEERSKRLGNLGIHRSAHIGGSVDSPLSNTLSCAYRLCPRVHNSLSTVALEAREAKRVTDLESLVLEQDHLIKKQKEEIDILREKIRCFEAQLLPSFSPHSSLPKPPARNEHNHVYLVSPPPMAVGSHV